MVGKSSPSFYSWQWLKREDMDTLILENGPSHHSATATLADFTLLLCYHSFCLWEQLLTQPTSCPAWPVLPSPSPLGLPWDADQTKGWELPLKFQELTIKVVISTTFWSSALGQALAKHCLGRGQGETEERVVGSALMESVGRGNPAWTEESP
jgi:hypothetical protein